MGERCVDFAPLAARNQQHYYTEPETGLLLLGHRYYDPGTGKFINRDPIGYEGGANLYAFCGGNPVNESDPSGFYAGPIVHLPTNPEGDEWYPQNWSQAWNRAKDNWALLPGRSRKVVDTLLTGIAVGGMLQSGTVPATPGIPHGFSNEEAYKNFCNNLTDGLREQGYGGTQPIFMGSSVTGKSYSTGMPFDVGRTSDYDIALADPSLLQKAADAGVEMRGGGIRTAPLNSFALKKLGLDGLSAQLSRQAGRKVSFMIYKNPGAALSRGPGIMVWPGHTE